VFGSNAESNPVNFELGVSQPITTASYVEASVRDNVPESLRSVMSQIELEGSPEGGVFNEEIKDPYVDVSPKKSTLSTANEFKTNATDRVAERVTL
jgi:hypothetical protein